MNEKLIAKFKNLARLCLFCPLFIPALPALPAGEQTIPSPRIFSGAWQNAGCPGDAFPGRKTANVKHFGALGNGVENDQPAVAAAVSSLAGEPGILFFPAGIYLIGSCIDVPSGVILRGQSPQETTLLFNFNGHAIRFLGSETGSWIPLSASASMHRNTVTLSDGGIFSAGDYALIRQDDDKAWNIQDKWAGRSAGQVLKITASAGNILTLERPLRHDYPLSRNPEIRLIDANKNSGVENMKLERLPAGNNKSRNNVHTVLFSYAAEGRVRGVHGRKCFGSHVAIYNSTKIEVAGCFFDGAHDHDGGGSGYGVRVQSRSGECLVENNIFRRLRHSMLLQAGANGNVFGYNYSIETKSDSHPGWAGDISLHGNYPYANLFEGNIVEHIWIDNSHRGINGPYNTFFRNRAERCGFNMTDPDADSQNVAGNELFRGGFTARLAAGSGYRFRGKGHFTCANVHTTMGVQPPGRSDLPDYSYYLAGNPAEKPEKPRWWTIPDELPVIGPPHGLSPAKNNPARARYLAGKDMAVFYPFPVQPGFP